MPEPSAVHPAKIQSNIGRWLRHTMLARGLSDHAFGSEVGLGRSKLRALAALEEPSNFARDLALYINLGRYGSPPLPPVALLQLALGQCNEEGRERPLPAPPGWTSRQKQALAWVIEHPQVLTDLQLDQRDSQEALELLAAYPQVFRRLRPLLPALQQWWRLGFWDALAQLVQTRAVRRYRRRQEGSPR